MSTTFENDLLVLLSDVARHMRTYADAEAQRFGITRAQLIILARLEDKPDISQNELAAIADVARDPASPNEAAQRHDQGDRARRAQDDGSGSAANEGKRD